MMHPMSLSNPPTPELAARLRLAVARLARQLRQTSAADLTPTQLSVLASVDAAGSMTLGELAERERVAPPTITKVVAKLVERDLMARTPDAIDRRIARVALTTAGETLLERTRSRKNAWLVKRLAAHD